MRREELIDSVAVTAPIITPGLDPEFLFTILSSISSGSVGLLPPPALLGVAIMTVLGLGRAEVQCSRCDPVGDNVTWPRITLQKTH